MKHAKLGFYIFLIPVILWLFLLIVIPHIDLLLMSFKSENIYGKPTFSFANYKNFFVEPIYWLTFVRTAIYSIIVTVITAIISLPIAFYITKVVNTKFSRFLSILLLMPFWVSELVRVYGWMILLRESGVVNHFLLKLGLINKPIELLYNDVSMVMVLVYTSMLFMVVPLISVMESLDDHLIEAAYDLGASTKDIVFKIIIPHSKPGLTSGAIVVFMLTLGNYLTPNLIGGKNSLWFTEQIYTQFIASFNWNQGAAFGFLLLVLSTVIIWLGLKVTRQNLSKVVQ
ncbi:ABC transporter permease [Deferribacterales bacterium Es71-Z0220]|uniref:ABC transporter permease n=1 Tax=Deferrivibrio essentukiensis TaxID=2880922 RepID=UPI001F606F56|nr:ABC transporter permease [Deferrivibrio essentukiensis]MCB4203489.1 ABC transporter permease [Deferrivibrio essentukiensis]